MTAWQAPAWLAPLQALEDYREKDYVGACATIEARCAEAGVPPDMVAQEFAETFDMLKKRYRWKDPVLAMRTTIDVQIAKAKTRMRNAGVQAGRPSAPEATGPTRAERYERLARRAGQA